MKKLASWPAAIILAIIAMASFAAICWWRSPLAAVIPHRVLSVCDLARLGRALDSKQVVLRGTLVVTGLGGEVRDARCPASVVGFADDGLAEPNDLYWQFNSSFDRSLMATGKVEENITVRGIVEAPGRAGAGRSYGSVLKLTKVMQFEIVKAKSPRRGS